jgi:hypothetical protein
VRIPDPVLRILRDEPGPAAEFDQAFALLTVDPAGYPHVALLSRSQVRPAPSEQELLAVVWPGRTAAHLEARRLAALVLADHACAHYLKLDVVRSAEHLSRLGVVLRLVDYASDSAGVELAPLSFRRSVALAAREGWDCDLAVLDLLGGNG